jgi:hypothetical protein
MKRSLQFGALVGVLVFTFWGSASREAQGATADCVSLSGKGCSSPGSTRECNGDYDISCGCYSTGSCSCSTTGKWNCAF